MLAQPDVAQGRESYIGHIARGRIGVFTGVFSLPFGELLIDKYLTLAGAGQDKTIIEASDAPGTASHRMLRVSFGNTVTVSGMTIRHGVEDSRGDRMVIFPVLPGGIVTIHQEFGGGVYKHGTLHLKNVPTLVYIHHRLTLFAGAKAF